MKMRVIYALYKGDEFIDLGTINELSAKHKMTKRYLRYLTSPRAHRMSKGNKTLLYRIED